MRQKQFCTSCNRSPICVICNVQMIRDRYVDVLYMWSESEPAYAINAAHFKCPKCNNNVIAGFAKKSFWNSNTSFDKPPRMDNDDVIVIML